MRSKIKVGERFTELQAKPTKFDKNPTYFKSLKSESMKYGLVSLENSSEVICGTLKVLRECPILQIMQYYTRTNLI